MAKPAKAHVKPVILVESHRQALKVRCVFWALLAAAVLALWGGWSIFDTFGLSPADGGVLRPLWQRLALGGFVAGLGLAAAGGMWLYLSLYALRIARDGDRVAITTMTPFGHRDREYPIGQVGESAYYHGRVHHGGSGGGMRVNAPWITLRVAGRRLPFIIDMQSETIKTGPLSKLARGGVKGWRKGGG